MHFLYLAGGGWPGTNDDVMKALETLQGVLSNADSKGHKVGTGSLP